MSTSNLLKVVLHWSGFGEEGSASVYFGGSEASHSDADLASALAAVDTLMETDTTPSTWTNLSELLYTGQLFDSLSLYEYDVAPGPATKAVHLGVSHAGSYNVAGMPLQNAVCVSALTGLSGPRHRGRVYMPSAGAVVSNTTGLISANGKVDNVVNYLSQAIGNMRQGLQTTLAIATLNPVVFSRAGGFATPIQSLSGDNRPDTQRRRAKSQVPSYHKVVAVTVQ